MSAEKETLRRVQDGLFHLQKGLTPFVEGRMKSKHGANWLHYASRATGGKPETKLDAYGLLKTIVDNWRDVFDDAFGRSDKHKARNFASMALEARNAISHLAIGLQDDEALRILYLRTLARTPTDREVKKCRSYIAETGRRIEAFEDILWSLLNSTEFLTKR